MGFREPGSGTPVISPSPQTITAGNSAMFTYSGGAFPNNLIVEAWIYDPAAAIPAGEIGPVNGGHAIGVTRNSCAEPAPLLTPIRAPVIRSRPTLYHDSFNISAAIDYTTPPINKFAGLLSILDRWGY
jgi:hypothetical protein